MFEWLCSSIAGLIIIQKQKIYSKFKDDRKTGKNTERAKRWNMILNVGGSCSAA
jgi:hypothetical protein